MEARTGPRVALVHDWLTGMRGGEKCLEAACRRWPGADLFTLVYTPGRLSRDIERMAVRPSFLNHLPGVGRYYRFLLPLMPAAIESFRLGRYDLVLSFSHCVAKAVRPPGGVPHVCYCFTPMRYAWHMREAYFREAGGLKDRVVRGLLAWLRHWDRRTAARVSHFIAISRTVQDRIRESYGRDSVVIYPPADTGYFTPARVRREEYYLVVSAFAPYKRVDLAVEACNRLGRHLLVIGTGQDERRLRTLAGPTVRFAGWQGNEAVREHFRRCRALLFPGEEDFGIVPVEANACGTPVIAYGRGGATETVRPLGEAAQPTGVWFAEQSVECLVEAIERFERDADAITPQACRQQSLHFTRERFESELFGYVEHILQPTPQPARRAA
jgi:glycosyltransferase involved in cell wall biosynthesis